MELPGMSEGLLEGEEEEETAWEAPVRNLDEFFTSMYNYHNNKGLPTILITQLCSIATLAFTTVFSTFLIAWVDWQALKFCYDEVTCGTISNYIISNPFKKFSFIYNTFIIIYCIILSTFLIWRIYKSILIIIRSIYMEQFYRTKLGIRNKDITSYTWDNIVQRLITLHSNNMYRIAIKDKLTEHDIVLRIMRRDNYMIGLINKNILDLRVPWYVYLFECIILLYYI